jgi:Holliday junction resolvase
MYPSNREQAIQTKIIEYLTVIGAYAVKVVKATKAGVPDVICCMNGKFIAIEVKRSGKQPEPLQIYNAQRIEKAGGIAICAHSVEELKTELTKKGMLCQ